MEYERCGPIFSPTIKRFHGQWVPDCEMDNDYRKSVHHDALTSEFHYLYFLPDVLVVSYVLSVTEYLLWAPAVALIYR